MAALKGCLRLFFAAKLSTRAASNVTLRELIVCNFKEDISLDSWTCTSDEVMGGKSMVELTRTKNGHASFCGHLSTDLPPDKVTKHSGFCTMRLNPKMNRWGTVLSTDVTSYDVMQLRLRGDGRTYMVSIQPPGYNTDDMYQAFIYTRGGPFWEEVTIPFTKFLFTTAGYLQDRQPTFHRYKTIGISIMDRINGPFCLELDYMKLRETFYQPKYFVEHAGRDLDY
ncbi:Hypothetical predicted protein [Paramuricea clavata]|uniref:Uncharacterized protein n=1 Tax=Paramuricea clavata TaxID=317549 RepID=A0A6S7I6P6_PARCT|nr:Hypothetical predicted protein [Paramuricea clavata]